jgi:hypothetical protein
MGKVMKELFVSISNIKGVYKASLLLSQFETYQGNPENICILAESIYSEGISSISRLLKKRQNYVANNLTIPARLIWEIGDNIFGLVNQLATNNITLDNVYEHLVRDLNVKRKWLEKVVIFRRYIPTKTSIPINTSWGYFEKSTKQKAINLVQEK